jgi:hypothetical protein
MLTIQNFIYASGVSGQYLPTQVSRFTALEIREQIQFLIAEGQITLAQALGDAGLACYPESVDMLTINSLLAVMRRDLQTSVDLLMDMMQVQGDRLAPAVYASLVKTLKNFITDSQMQDLVEMGLEHFPEETILWDEKAALDTHVLLSNDSSHLR